MPRQQARFPFLTYMHARVAVHADDTNPAVARLLPVVAEARGAFVAPCHRSARLTEGLGPMARAHHNPAIFAGLAGSAVLAAPTPALAVDFYGHEFPSGDPGVTFVAGLVMGAFTATCVTLAACHAGRRGEAGVGRDVEAGSPTVAFERMPRESGAAARPAAGVADARAASGPVAGGGAHAVSAPVTEGGAHLGAGRPPRQRLKRDGGGVYVPDLEGLADDGARAAAMGDLPVPSFDDVPRPSAGATEIPQPTLGSEATPAGEAGASLVGEAEVTPAGEAVPSPPSAVVARAKGVAETLAERLESSRMRDLPVIERADGTVGDVGETWWNDSVGAEHVAGATSRTPGTQGVDDVLKGNSAALFTVQTLEEAQAAAEMWRKAVAGARAGKSAPEAAEGAPADAEPAARQAAGERPSLEAGPAAASVRPDGERGQARGAHMRQATGAPEGGRRWEAAARRGWEVALDALDEPKVDEAEALPDAGSTGDAGLWKGRHFAVPARRVASATPAGVPAVSATPPEPLPVVPGVAPAPVSSAVLDEVPSAASGSASVAPEDSAEVPSAVPASADESVAAHIESLVQDEIARAREREASGPARRRTARLPFREPREYLHVIDGTGSL